MALRTRLFLAFIGMIVLAVVTALVSIRAFNQAKQGIDETSGLIDFVAEDLVPTSEKWINISAQLITAGIDFYSYSHAFTEKDFASANAELAALDEEFAQLDAILARSGSGRLDDSRKALAECRTHAADLKRLGGRLKACENELKRLNQEFIGAQDEISAIADEEYTKAYESLKDVLGSDAEDAADLVAQRSGRVEFLSDVFDCVAWSNQAFWRGQSLRGAEARAYYAESRKNLENLIEAVGEYNNEENVPDRRERDLFAQMTIIARRMIATTGAIADKFGEVETLSTHIDGIADAASTRVRSAASSTAR